jgi:hypothetical protein
MGSLLGGLLGGGQSQQAAPATGQGGLDLGSLLGGLMGGGGGGLLGATSSAQSNPLNAAIVQGVAKKLGLPPIIAQMVVSFVLSKLAGGQRSTGASLNFEEVAGMLQSQGSVDQRYVESSGLVEELAQQTGLDQETASRSLTVVINMMGGAQAPEPTRKPTTKKQVVRATRQE